MIAGAGALTTLIAIRTQFSSLNLIMAVIANMFCVYLILLLTNQIEKKLGAGGLYMIKKFFGIILLAISIKLFTSNITFMISDFINH
jgi:multiple antibiotic resistance protein